MIAVNADDVALLGLVDAVFLSHVGGKKHLCKKRPFAEKERRRWLDATNTAASLVAAGAVCVTVIADREGDIYEEFACRPAEAELLIRAHHDRILEDGGALYGCMADVAELGGETIDLPANPGRPARKLYWRYARERSHRYGRNVTILPRRQSCRRTLRSPWSKRVRSIPRTP
jgi:hypothetical protein